MDQIKRITQYRKCKYKSLQSHIRCTIIEHYHHHHHRRTLLYLCIDRTALCRHHQHHEPPTQSTPSSAQRSHNTRTKIMQTKVKRINRALFLTKSGNTKRALDGQFEWRGCEAKTMMRWPDYETSAHHKRWQCIIPSSVWTLVHWDAKYRVANEDCGVVMFMFGKHSAETICQPYHRTASELFHISYAVRVYLPNTSPTPSIIPDSTLHLSLEFIFSSVTHTRNNEHWIGRRANGKS